MCRRHEPFATPRPTPSPTPTFNSLPVSYHPIVKCFTTVAFCLTVLVMAYEAFCLTLCNVSQAAITHCMSIGWRLTD